MLEWISPSTHLVIFPIVNTYCQYCRTYQGILFSRQFLGRRSSISLYIDETHVLSCRRFVIEVPACQLVNLAMRVGFAYLALRDSWFILILTTCPTSRSVGVQLCSWAWGLDICYRGYKLREREKRRMSLKKLRGTLAKKLTSPAYVAKKRTLLPLKLLGSTATERKRQSSMLCGSRGVMCAIAAYAAFLSGRPFSHVV